MSVLSDEQRRRGFPAHQQANGDIVTRLPKEGDRQSGIVGIWKEYTEDQSSSQRPERTLAEGQQVIRHGLLLVSTDQTVKDDDAWAVSGETWQVRRIGQMAQGYREIYLQRDDKTRTTRPGGQRVI